MIKKTMLYFLLTFSAFASSNIIIQDSQIEKLVIDYNTNIKLPLIINDSESITSIEYKPNRTILFSILIDEDKVSFDSYRTLTNSKIEEINENCNKFNNLIQEKVNIKYVYTLSNSNQSFYVILNKENCKSE